VNAYVVASASYPNAAVLGDREASCSMCATPVAEPPSTASIPARLRRGLGAHQKMVVDAWTRAIPDAMRSEISIVHGSALGELETAAILATSTEPSPARFSTSVHSSIVGILSLAFGNRRGHSTLSAGPDTLFACVVDAFGRLAEGEPFVSVVVADETDERLREADDTPFAFAMLLSRTATEGARAIRLETTEGESDGSRSLFASVQAFDHAIRCERGRSILRPSMSGHATIAVDASGVVP